MMTTMAALLGALPLAWDPVGIGAAAPRLGLPSSEAGLESIVDFSIRHRWSTLARDRLAARSGRTSARFRSPRRWPHRPAMIFRLPSCPLGGRPVGTMLITIGITLSASLPFSSSRRGLASGEFRPSRVCVATGAAPNHGFFRGGSAQRQFTLSLRHEMTSTSTIGGLRHAAVRVNRDIDGAARDVQAAINAALRSSSESAFHPSIPQSDLRRPIHSRLDVRTRDPGSDVRCGVEHPAAKALAG